jgi:hypothetical protein
VRALRASSSVRPCFACGVSAAGPSEGSKNYRTQTEPGAATAETSLISLNFLG